MPCYSDIQNTFKFLPLVLSPLKKWLLLSTGSDRFWSLKLTLSYRFSPLSCFCASDIIYPPRLLQQNLYQPFLYQVGVSIVLKRSCSTLLKNISKLGYRLRGFRDEFGLNDGISPKFSESSFLKYHFIDICLWNSSKSLFNWVSLILLSIRA